MGRKTWFDDDGMKKGEWTAEEDEKLIAYINEHGMCDWRSIPKRAGIYIGYTYSFTMSIYTPKIHKHFLCYRYFINM